MMIRVWNRSAKALLALGASMALAIGLASPASADLLVYEPFDYQAGAGLLGLDGGGGFDAAWVGRANNAANVPAGSTSIQAASLAHPTNPGDLPTAGGHVVITGEFGTSQPARGLSSFAKSQLAAAPTTWFSFLGQRLGAATDPAITNLPNNPYPRGVNTSLFREDVATDDELIGFGNSSNHAFNTWSIIPDGSGGNTEGAYDPPGANPGLTGGPTNMGAATFPYNELQWAVIRIDHQAGADDVYLWLSPDPNVEPSIASADAAILNTDANALDYGGIGAIRPFIGNNAGTAGMANFRPFGVLALDELRIGTSYAAMSSSTVVPEPASCLMLLLGTLLAGLRRVRR